MPNEAALMTAEEEIRAGLPKERGRLDEALWNHEFYQGKFDRFPVRTSGSASATYDSGQYPRTAPIMQKIVKSLTANLYSRGPKRSLKAPVGVPQKSYNAASLWVESVYRSNSINAYFQEADRLATATNFSAFQVSVTKDPNKPIKVSLWNASELVIWLDPEDPLKLLAVGTLDVAGSKRRLRLWTEDEISCWTSSEYNTATPNSATTFTLDERRPNPYRCIPFSFVHFEFPTSSFWTPGPGTNLRDVNDSINFFMTENFDCVRYNTRPVIVLKNVRVGFRPPTPVKPGDIWDLPAGGDGAEDNPPQDASYLQADPGFIEAGWKDTGEFLGLTLETHGIPQASIRLVQNAARSGISIIAEQIPLGLWAESRERPFSHYEDALVRLVLKVGLRYLQTQQSVGRATATQLEDVVSEPGLVLRWPSMFVKLPGQERDQQDTWLLENKLTSRTRILMERQQLTKEEALAELAEISQELVAEQALFAPLTPPALKTGSGGGQEHNLGDEEETDRDLEDELDNVDDEKGGKVLATGSNGKVEG